MKFCIVLCFTLFVFILSCEDNGSAPDLLGERVELYAPEGGEVFHPGDTIVVSWEYKEWEGDLRFMTYPEISLDSGKTFGSLLYRSVVHETPAYDTFWIVPDDSSMFSGNVQIKVYEYNKKTILDRSDYFAIGKRQELSLSR